MRKKKTNQMEIKKLVKGQIKHDHMIVFEFLWADQHICLK